MSSRTSGRADTSPTVAPGLVLLVAILAMSWAGPLVRLSGSPALAIAAWRLIFSVGLLGLVVLLGGGRETWRSIRRMGRADWAAAVLAGLFLAAHFWSWIASLEWTSVANSVVLVSTQPIFVAILSAVVLRERPDRTGWLGIGIAVLGAMVIGWGARGGGTLTGDALALAGAAFAAGYFIIGRKLRQHLDLRAYTGVVYGIAALALLAAAGLHPEVPLTGYPARDCWIFITLAAGPMMVGHTGINYALRYMRAYTANLAALGEPVGAMTIAWLLPAIAEVPSTATLAGGLLILLGIGIGMRRRRSG